MRHLDSLLNDWAGAVDATVIDEAQIERAFHRALRCCRLPLRKCVFYHSIQDAVQSADACSQKPSDEWTLRWRRASDCSDTSQWDNARQMAITRLRTTRWIHVLYASHEAYHLMIGGVYSAWWGAASDILCTYDRFPAQRFWVTNPWAHVREAIAYGTFAFWVGKRMHILVKPECLYDTEGRLHCETGPAIRWKDGSGVYFWHGVKMRKEIILSPESLKPKEIIDEKDVEVRRIMIERYGRDRLIREVGEAISICREGILYRLELPEEREPWVMVEVTCPSTGRKYLLRVPPRIRTVRQAVAWTFGLRTPMYYPSVET